MSLYTYEGTELDLFAQARNWKAYFSAHITPLLGETVLEVGAGIGGTTPLICTRPHRQWICLEADSSQAHTLSQRIEDHPLPATVEVIAGTLDQLDPYARFDSILYIDVIEHIADDHQEMHNAASHLNPDGRLVVLSPAHQFLFTEFDRAVGHCRRYSKRTLLQAIPDQLKQEKLIYLDSVGMLASLANRLLLKSAQPTSKQIALWDGLMVPLSRLLDPVLFHCIGKSVLGICRNPST